MNVLIKTIVGMAFFIFVMQNVSAHTSVPLKRDDY